MEPEKIPPTSDNCKENGSCCAETWDHESTSSASDGIMAETKKILIRQVVQDNIEETRPVWGK